jgi:hypothetical protein
LALDAEHGNSHSRGYPEDLLPKSRDSHLMEDLIDRMIYHPLVALPMMHFTDLICGVNGGLAATAFALACTLSLKLIGVLRSSDRLS